MLSKLRNFLIYILLYHCLYLILEIMPNLFFCNRIRGEVLGLFFKKKGRNFALASGCTLVMIRNLEVRDNVYIAHDCWINASGGLTIKSGVIVSPKVVIATTKHKYKNGAVVLRESEISPVVIGEGCWICSNATVTKGVEVGEGSIVCAGSVVTKSLPAFSLCAGQPAIRIGDVPHEA